MSNIVKNIAMQNGVGGFDTRPIGVDLENVYVSEDKTLGDFTGATSQDNGSTGLVPAPVAGDEEKVLRGDGTWGTVKSLEYTIDGEVGKYSTIQNSVENVANGMYSHAEGLKTTASGLRSHTEGRITIASGTDSHAEGSYTTASGSSSHAEGSSTLSSGNASHAEGYETTAQSSNSHAEGSGTLASGSHSHAQNYQTIAQGIYQTAIGKYNEAQGTSDSFTNTDYAFIIGNGTTNTNRSNAFAIQWDGTFVFADGTTITPAQFAQLKALLS